jgi:hypothetical protein
LTQLLTLQWLGPFAWPDFESENALPSLPSISGVYLQTFRVQQGFAGYGAGITRRRVAVRFREHTRRFLNGEYTVLDVSAAERGIRREIWHGWGYARSHREEFITRQSEITEAARRQLAAFHIFVAAPGSERRLLERLEATIMSLLYQQPSPLSELPDKGMFLSGRRASEPPLHVVSQCVCELLGIPNQFDV